MRTAQTRFDTEQGAKYLAQLCKHFAHKTTAEWSDTEGRIEFTGGRAHLSAQPAGLAIRVEAEDEGTLDRLKGVVWSHLVRFAFREPERQPVWDAP
ncbi:DUF2218 domain-containing protein [Rubellimicrobium roseum]|uniref:DUF2218 domain-containing protein n=1 Tax=Rubellimicrobium roseum TaxID=687525 RepID=A0A5C4N6P1_9RHOB|nr:DUF2218 domain-containing protein [Rubellimicrobium roseum]TNC66611.1 DUF2218 domain-containing protein [Rubellimicrobium roseum]